MLDTAKDKAGKVLEAASNRIIWLVLIASIVVLIAFFGATRINQFIKLIQLEMTLLAFISIVINLILSFYFIRRK